MLYNRFDLFSHSQMIVQVSLRYKWYKITQSPYTVFTNVYRVEYTSRLIHHRPITMHHKVPKEILLYILTCARSIGNSFSELSLSPLDRLAIKLLIAYYILWLCFFYKLFFVFVHFSTTHTINSVRRCSLWSVYIGRKQYYFFFCLR